MSRAPAMYPPPVTRFALLASIALLVLLTGCSEVRNGTGMISQKIGEAAREPGTREVDLAQFTTFGWDRFYVFTAGTSRDEVCRFMGANRQHCGRIVHYPAVPDDAVTLVFALAGRVTHTELHALDNGRIDVAPAGEGVARSAAVFKVRRTVMAEGLDRIVLEPQ